MKTAVLTLGLYKGDGGVNKCVQAFQKALEPDIISWVDPVEIADSPLIWDKSTIVRGSKVPLLKSLIYPGFWQATKAEAIIREMDFVACHSFWRWHNIWLFKIAKKHGVPYWFVPHGGLDPYVFESNLLWKRAFLAFGGARFIQEADCVIFSTRREREKALRLCKPSQTEVIYWPLDDSDLCTVRDFAGGQRIRCKLGINEKARCLLYFGRLHPMKRPLETIDAVAACGFENLHLIIVGNEFGITIEECRKRAAERGIENRVHVVGPVYGKHVADYFSASDAYISLSRRENFNFTAAECMAAGLPVILSPGNDLVGELDKVDCGWFLEDDAVSAVVTRLNGICQLPDSVFQEKGCAGSQWATKELSFETFKERLCALAHNQK